MARRIPGFDVEHLHPFVHHIGHAHAKASQQFLNVGVCLAHLGFHVAGHHAVFVVP